MSMPTKTYYRSASTSAGTAMKELLEAGKSATIEEFDTRVATADDARNSKGAVTPGTKIFVATLKFAEDGEVEESEPEPKEEGPSETESKPKPEPSFESDGPEDPASDDSADDAPPKPKAEGLGGPEGHEPKKMSPDEEIVHLLRQILDAVQGGGPLKDGKPGPVHDPAAMKDDVLPPHPPAAGPGPGPAGAGGPGGMGAPLPPPVEKQAPGLAFAHYDPSIHSFSVIRRQANELGARGLRAEAENVYPTHRVARLVTAGTAEIDGYTVDLAKNNIAVLTLTAR